MEKFTNKFLNGKAKFHFEREVLNIERDERTGNVEVEELPTKSFNTLTYLSDGGKLYKSFKKTHFQSKIIHLQRMQQSENTSGNTYLNQPQTRRKLQFRGIVLHSSQFVTHLDKNLKL